MPVAFLLDEHVSPEHRTQVLCQSQETVIWRIGDPGAPAPGTSDPELLRWCEANRFLLVTANRRSIPRHLAEHLEQGGHVPRILTLRPGANVGDVVEDLVLVAGATVEGELQDQIAYLPL